MKPSLRLLLTFAAVLGLSLSARADSFGLAAQVVSDSNVLNAGSTALAYDVAGISGVAATVNGVVFSSALTQSGITLAIAGSTFSTAQGSHSISTMSSKFTSILSSNYGTTSLTVPIVLTFSNLAANESYELQLFSGIAQNGSGTSKFTVGAQSAILTFGPGNSTTNTGDSDVVLSFQTGATPSNEVVNITALTGTISPYGLINAVNLRDMGIAAVPEPSTWLMLGLGTIGFAVFFRRRKLAAVRA